MFRHFSGFPARMASRQLRRLAGDKALPAPSDAADEDDVAPAKAKPSAFALVRPRVPLVVLRTTYVRTYGIRRWRETG